MSAGAAGHFKLAHELQGGTASTGMAWITCRGCGREVRSFWVWYLARWEASGIGRTVPPSFSYRIAINVRDAHASGESANNNSAIIFSVVRSVRDVRGLEN
jgi:hypothetical protein